MLSRRALVAGVIAALHIAVLYALGTMTVRRAPQAPPTHEPITWLDVAKVEPAKPLVPVLPPPVATAHPLDVPKLPGVAITPPTPSPVPMPSDLAALRSYVWCGRLDDGKPLQDNPQPCAALKLDLQKDSGGSPAPRGPEQAVTRRFDKQYSSAKAPVLLPCFGGGGVSIICLVGGIANGFEFTPGSYAGSESAKCNSRLAGTGPCARNYSLQSFAPTNTPPAR